MAEPIMLMTQEDTRAVLREIVREEITAALRDVLAPSDGWLTVREAAKAWGVSERTVYNWAREGLIEAQGSGKRRRVRRT